MLGSIQKPQFPFGSTDKASNKFRFGNEPMVSSKCVFVHTRPFWSMLACVIGANRKGGFVLYKTYIFSLQNMLFYKTYLFKQRKALKSIVKAWKSQDKRGKHRKAWEKHGKSIVKALKSNEKH